MPEELLRIANGVVRGRVPEGDGPFPVLLLLHGLSGDENSMWIFTPRLPGNHLLLSPRAPYQALSGGFSWNQTVHGWPRLEDFLPSIDALLGLLIPAYFPAGDFSNLHLMGFSQGAALAVAFTLLHPEKITSLAMLSGFVPKGLDGTIKLHRLGGLPVFLAHGIHDSMVPVEEARQSAATLESAGGKVTYCEDEVGHKLSANCFKGLGAFFRDQGC